MWYLFRLMWRVSLVFVVPLAAMNVLGRPGETREQDKPRGVGLNIGVALGCTDKEN